MALITIEHLSVTIMTDDSTKLDLLIKKQIEMAETQKELATRIRQMGAQLQKVGNESAVTLQKVKELQEQVANMPNADPELVSAVDEVAAHVKAVDDMVPDAVEPGTEENPDLEAGEGGTTTESNTGNNADFEEKTV